MTRIRLRAAYTPEQLAEVYNAPYDHTRWPDHIQRVAQTVQTMDAFAAEVGARTVVDLSCGDGAVVNQSRHPWERRVLGDYTTTGPLEIGLESLKPVDMYVCSETLEHLEDPDAVLRQIREKSSHLVLTTPVDEVSGENPEHYWGWGVDDIRVMLRAAGWDPRNVDLFKPQVETVYQHYTFQIWTCS